MPNTYTQIATYTIPSATSSYTFSSIPSTYTDLRLIVNNQMSGASGIKIQFNSDTGSNYSQTQLLGYGTSSTSAGRVTGASSIYNNLVYGDSTISSWFTLQQIDIMNYSNSTTNKTTLWRYGTPNQPSNYEVGFITGLWRSTAAINSITISVWNAVNFVAGSNFSLYGIAAA